MTQLAEASALAWPLLSKGFESSAFKTLAFHSVGCSALFKPYFMFHSETLKPIYCYRSPEHLERLLSLCWFLDFSLVGLSLASFNFCLPVFSFSFFSVCVSTSLLELQKHISVIFFLLLFTFEETFSVSSFII